MWAASTSGRATCPGEPGVRVGAATRLPGGPRRAARPLACGDRTRGGSLRVAAQAARAAAQGAVRRRAAPRRTRVKQGPPERAGVSLGAPRQGVTAEGGSWGRGELQRSQAQAGIGRPLTWEKVPLSQWGFLLRRQAGLPEPLHSSSASWPGGAVPRSRPPAPHLGPGCPPCPPLSTQGPSCGHQAPLHQRPGRLQLVAGPRLDLERGDGREGEAGNRATPGVSAAPTPLHRELPQLRPLSSGWASRPFCRLCRRSLLWALGGCGRSGGALRGADEGASSSAQPGTPLLALLGFRLEGIFPATVLPLLLTMVSTPVAGPCVGVSGSPLLGCRLSPTACSLLWPSAWCQSGFCGAGACVVL